MRAFGGAVILAVLCFASPASPASAQSILIRVTEAESGDPIVGAFVSLLDEDGRVLRSALTGETGRFLFPIPAPGVFRIKAEMIGRETRVSPPLTLQADGSGQTSLSLPVHAISLEGINVEADQRCRLRPDEASEIARVWEEARKALTVQAWTEEEGFYRLEITTYERDLDGMGRRVEREDRKGTSLVTRTPFASLPAEDLMSGGFVRPQEGGGHQYYGPDAPVLLSDLFLDTHCFRLRRSGDLPSSIGLDFEPLRGAELSDIEGTLWLSEENGHLQFMEYEYTTAPYREARGIAGGRVEFQAMPNGAWIIDKWWIRAPIMGLQPGMARAGDSGIRVAGIRETGGEVQGVSTLSRDRISEVQPGVLTGLVWDSTRSGPLAGATVFLSGTQASEVTDAEGRFLMDGLLGGIFTASFTHPRLDSLGIGASESEVEVIPGEVSDLTLSIPSTGTILLATCLLEEGEEAAGVLSGTVRDLSSGEPIPGATVRIEWQVVHRLDPVARATNEFLEVRANAEGYYTACGIPRDELFQVRASFLELPGNVVEGEFEAAEHRLVDLVIDLPQGILTNRVGGVYSVDEYGAQGVQGVLLEPESGEPVRGAEITLQDGSGRITATGVTNQRGFFRILAPVPGRYILSAQALGYAEVKDEVVDVSLGHLAVLEVEMPPDALELEPLVVTAERRAFHLEMEGFYERKELGGIFITPEALEERQPRKLTDVLFGLPGVRVGEPSLGAGPRTVWFRIGERFDGSICWPMVFVDRHLVSNGGLVSNAPDPTAVDDFVHGLDVLAVEVYTGPSKIPAEFNGANAGCGVIVIWTHRGGGG